MQVGRGQHPRSGDPGRVQSLDLEELRAVGPSTWTSHVPLPLGFLSPASWTT